MPNIIPISALPAAAGLTGAELVPIVQGSTTVQTTAQHIADLGGGAVAAVNVSYDNAGSGLAGTNAQDAIDELAALANAPPVFLRSVVFSGQGVGTNGFTLIGMNLAQRGTTSNPTTTGAGTRGEATMRGRLTSAASGFQTIDFYTDVLRAYRAVSGNPLAGGFKYTSELVLTTADVGQAFFAGLAAQTGYLFVDTVDLSAVVDMCGFGKSGTDTNLQFFHNDASGTATKVDLGVVFTGLIGKLLRFQVDTTDTGDVHYLLTDLETGSVLASGTVSTDLPTIDQALQTHEMADTQSTSTAVVLDMARRIVVAGAGS